MTPKEEAKELLKRFESVSKPFMKGSEVQVHINPEHAKQCAFICVDEMLALDLRLFDIEFLKEVKKEIEKL